MQHMGWSWRDLQDTPAVIVNGALADYEAAAEASRTLERWGKR